MVCVYCQSDTQVVNSRPQKRRNSIWRRRKCLSCDAIFTTTEVADSGQALITIKSGYSEPFMRDKLYLSVYDSVRHRKNACTDATELTDSIVARLQALTNSPSIETSMITEVALSFLDKFDRVAATHYRAFHPE